MGKLLGDDLRRKQAHRPGRADAPQARAQAPRRSRGAATGASMVCSAARSDTGRSAAKVTRRGWCYAQFAADLASSAETGPTAQKKSLHATERDTEANRKQREEFVARIAAIAPERLIFLDESGATTSRSEERTPELQS